MQINWEQMFRPETISNLNIIRTWLEGWTAAFIQLREGLSMLYTSLWKYEEAAHFLFHFIASIFICYFMSAHTSAIRLTIIKQAFATLITQL